MITAGVLLVVTLLILVCRRVLSGTLPKTWFDPVLDTKALQVRRLARSGFAPDVLVAGHSEPFDWFDPALFTQKDPTQRRSYNAGANLSVWQVAEDWLNSLLRVWAPSIVVLGFDPLDFNANGIEQARCVSSHRGTSAGRYRGLVPLAHRALRRAACLRPWRRAVWRALRRGPLALPLDAQLIGSLGEDLHKVGRSYEMNCGFESAFKERWLKDFSVGEAPVASARRVLRLAGGSGAHVVVVLCPFTADYLALLPGGTETRAEVLALLELICAEESAQLIVPPLTLLDEADFADPVHVNDRGREKMTVWLATQPF